MNPREPLCERAVALSISESPDMAALGLAREHLDDAMAEVARHLLAMGSRLLYGGDLRPGGFTELLFELVARHRRDVDVGGRRPSATNFLAWPVHVGMEVGAIEGLAAGLEGAAELVLLDAAGRPMTFDDRRSLAPRPADDEEWAAGLTTMRRSVTASSDARIVLGGRVEAFKGRMPGIAEEALVTLREGKPLYVLGGFGGCARDLAERLGLLVLATGVRPTWLGQEEFTSFSGHDLGNGLSQAENELLAGTVHIDQAVALILRGLLRRTGDESQEGAP